MWLLKIVLMFTPAFGTAEGNKSEAVTYLRDVLKQNYTRLAELDQTTQNTLSRSKLDNEEQFSPEASQKQKSLEERITQLGEERAELILRQEFLDRLIFRLDSKFQGGDLQRFFYDELKDMTFREATSEESSSSRLWKFLSELTTAVQDIPERNEDMASFIEGFMSFSSISNPKTAKEFMKTRQYTNGKTSVAAESTSRDDIGEVVEQRLKQMKLNTLKLHTNVK